MTEQESQASGFFAGNAQARLFTLAEANSTLPLVRRVVDDIVGNYPRLQELQQRYAQLKSTGEKNDAIDDVENELGAVAERINRLIRELQPIGCQFKDLAMGLVDFPATHDGRTVLLCWKHGEERIDYWHEVNNGAAFFFSPGGVVGRCEEGWHTILQTENNNNNKNNNNFLPEQ